MATDATAPIRVLIADDHAVVREGIRHVLSSDRGFDIIGEAANGREAVALAQSHAPDVVVLDLSMPVLSGLDAVAEIRASAPHTRILVLSIHDAEEYVVQSVRAGAQGYLRKDSSPGELRSAIRAIHQGGTVFSPPVARTLASALQGQRETNDRRRLVDTLTARERDVLIAVASGRTNREIATELGLSVRTVESHREALMRKLDLRGVAAITKFALDSGLLSTKRRE